MSNSQTSGIKLLSFTSYSSPTSQVLSPPCYLSSFLQFPLHFFPGGHPDFMWTKSKSTAHVHHLGNHSVFVTIVVIVIIIIIKVLRIYFGKADQQNTFEHHTLSSLHSMIFYFSQDALLPRDFNKAANYLFGKISSSQKPQSPLYGYRDFMDWTQEPDSMALTLIWLSGHTSLPCTFPQESSLGDQFRLHP